MATHIWYALTVAVYLVALWNVGKVLGSRTTPGAAFGWIMFHLALPIAAIPLYWLIGDFRIKGYVRRHRAAARLLDAHEAEVLAAEPSPGVDDVAPELRRTYGPMKTMLERFGAIFAPRPGAVTLLVDGDATFNAIFDAIKSAERYILVQYYIVRSDRLGLELKRLLIEKARAGVPVFMLFDDMGSFWLSSGYTADLKASGVRIARFLPMASIKRFFQLNFRNHRKLVVIDGHTAFTGGLNVGEEYVGRKSAKSRLRYWRDTHVSVSGRPVAHLEDIFQEDWYFATGDVIELPEATSEVPAEQQPAQAFASLVQVVPTGPTDEAVISVLYIMQLIGCAESRLWIATPYFVPDPAIMRALELAAYRGVDVRLILPRRSDNQLVQWVSLSYGEQLVPHGIKVMCYTPAFMHQKVLLVDDTLASVGTMNMDNRALYLNFETMVTVHDRAFNASVAAMLERDFLACRFLAPDKGPKIAQYLRKLRGNAARLLAPLL
jgi:cardiolipin synthase